MNNELCLHVPRKFLACTLPDSNSKFSLDEYVVKTLHYPSCLSNCYRGVYIPLSNWTMSRIIASAVLLLLVHEYGYYPVHCKECVQKLCQCSGGKIVCQLTTRKSNGYQRNTNMTFSVFHFDTTCFTLRLLLYVL